MDYGFTITKQGWKLLAKLLTGSQLEITRVMVGSGKVPEGNNPGEMIGLVQPVALATSSVPQVENDQVSFIVEYRCDLNGGLKEGFWLNEFGVFANDPDSGEVLLYYATMGDYPQYVSAFTGGSVDIRRYPVSIALSESPDVHLDYPAGALVTAEEMEEALDKQGVPAGGLEGQALVKAGAESESLTKWGSYISNPNLLINADFRNPVNRNGKSEYTSVGYTIDRWAISSNTSLTINSGFIRFEKKSDTTGQPPLSQSLNNVINMQDNSVTLSILCRGNGQIRLEIFGSDNNDNISSLKQKVFNLTDTENWQLKMISVNSVKQISNIVIAQFTRNNMVGAYAEITATKLEIGDQQTLAHQDAAGNWVLNDPPNFDLQYFLCSQYSPVTGEFVRSQHSNPNLLDNWYFADPINQRGQTEYTASYTIDRWVTRNFSNDGTFKVGTTSEGLKMELLKTPNSHCALVQIVENTPFYIGKQVTFSVLCKTTGSIKFVPLMKQNQNSGQFKIGSISYDNEWCCLSCTGIVPDSASSLTCFMQTEGGEAGDSVTVIAAKLELGSVQTLAHKEGDTWVLNDPPPNKALELAKCQRYQFVTGGGNNKMIGTFDVGTASNKILTRIAIPLPTTMRETNPAPIILGSGMLRLVQISPQIKAIGSISSTANPESTFLSNNYCYVTYETPELTAGMTGIVDTTNTSTFLCIDNNI